MNIKKILLLLFVMLIAASCEKSDRIESLGGVIKPNVRADLLTKGTTVTNENLTGFKMMAVASDHTTGGGVPVNGIYFTAFAKKTGGTWDTYSAAGAVTPTQYYWINASPIVFWSWYPYDLNSDQAGILSVKDTPVIPMNTGYNTLGFSYTLPAHVDGADASNQKDLVFAGNVESRTYAYGTGEINAATSSNSAYTRKDNQIDILFHHPLSKIQFGVDLKDNSFDKTLKIMKIELINLRRHGTCAFMVPSSFVWNDPETADLNNTWSQSFGTTGADFSSYGTASPSLPGDWPLNSSNNLYICSNAFFVIPQTFAANAARISVTFDSGGTPFTKTADLPATAWEADHYYTYKIAAHGEMSKLKFDVSLADWSEREHYIPIY